MTFSPRFSRYRGPLVEWRDAGLPVAVREIHVGVLVVVRLVPVTPRDMRILTVAQIDVHVRNLEVEPEPFAVVAVMMVVMVMIIVGRGLSGRKSEHRQRKTCRQRDRLDCEHWITPLGAGIEWPQKTKGPRPRDTLD